MKFNFLNNNKQSLDQLSNQVYNQFSINETTKENYLKFKDEIKKASKDNPISHFFNVAYYIFKHRIGRDPETNLVDSNVIEKYLDDVVIPACYKGLYNGRIYPHCGGDCINSAIRAFKEYVRYYYNTYADPELVKQYHEEKKKQWKR